MTVLVQTANAQRNIDKFIYSNDGRTIGIKLTTDGSTIRLPNGSVASMNYDGGIYAGGVKAFADGGFASGIYKGRQGGIHKFAESEMGVPWETYISGRASSRDRNIGIWQKTGQMLGVVGAGAGPVQVSLAGATFAATIDGRPITMMIQEQIASHDSRSARVVSQGVSGW